MSQPDRTALRQLARDRGIMPAYRDISGVRRLTSDATREALLAAMGVDASSERAASDALAQLEHDSRTALAGPVTVVGAGDPDFRIAVPPGARGRIQWRVDLITEDGDRRGIEGDAVARRGQRSMTITLPAGLADGYHAARIRLETDGPTVSDDTFLIVSPGTCTPIRDVIGDDRVFGVNANLYTIRSQQNWGAGDLTDLAALCEWTGREGGTFVGVNPLHALRNAGAHISPYSPVSRLFRNPLYIDVMAVPEFADTLSARALAESAATRSTVSALRASDRVDYESVMSVKRPVLELLHRAFRSRTMSGETPRGRAYAEFTWRHGVVLRDFATFHALAERFGVADWREWPAAFRDPRSAEVDAFRDANADAVDFHAFVQFELDRQLGVAADAGRAAGLRIGVYGDLAIGSAVSGSDRWTFPDLFLEGATVGAPPDDYAQHGQDWSLPAIDPNRLVADRYRYWILLIRNALAHCGALRIDHVMGLFRQFWIPAGRSAAEGAYVRYPSNALLAVLAIESRRRGAIVIGEDLGTVPGGLPSRLARHEILSTRVLYFERESDGEFRPPSAYSRRAMVTVNTHDHVPLAGWWIGREIETRHGIGDLTDDERDRALARRGNERESLRRRLAAARILPRGTEVEAPDLAAAVHAYLGRTRAPLLGVALDDLAGEVDPVNLPGVTADRFPSWTRRMRIPLDAVPRDAGVDRALQGVESRVRGIAG
ncbi:MAG TPA: 4-alpha-glucanotransferase [Longimicrobiales bacterium]|nr:4-alpha-glucanotransferase [Longimicrobiales bacterium]